LSELSTETERIVKREAAMNIIVHRGTHQIGGCVTEICTEQTRIIIDMGSELPDEQGNSPDETLCIDGVTHGLRNCDGIFFTHYHGDHIGMLDRSIPDIPLFMGPAAKEIHLAFQKRIHSRFVSTIEKINTFQSGIKIEIGDIHITPYMVDHSAFDSYMFLIESNGKRILHTGDFRTHGFRGKTVVPLLKKYVGQVDVLITEGTMLSRDELRTITEHELQKQARDYLSKYKYVFVLCASTNIDRMASFHEATPRGKYFLCDAYQKNIIEIARKYGASHTPLYSFKKALVFGKGLVKKAEHLGFCMMVRGNSRFSSIVNQYKDSYNSDCLVIYSMWDGYLKQADNKMNLLMSGFQNTVHLHTSGHATHKAIKDVCDAVYPKQAIIPIHSYNPAGLEELGLSFPIQYLHDGEVYKL